MSMRKLKITEMKRLSEEEFKESRKMALTVVLDDVRSMHNIGAVFRTADAFRVENIYLCGISATPLSRADTRSAPTGDAGLGTAVVGRPRRVVPTGNHQEIHKTALGAEFTVSWRYFGSVLEAIDELHGNGYRVFAIEQCTGSTMLDELEIDGDEKYAIVFGNEVKGVCQEAIDRCDGCIEIPQYGTKHSLNVSVAAGIVMWEFIKCMNSVDKIGG